MLAYAMYFISPKIFYPCHEIFTLYIYVKYYLFYFIFYIAFERVGFGPWISCAFIHIYLHIFILHSLLLKSTYLSRVNKKKKCYICKKIIIHFWI